MIILKERSWHDDLVRYVQPTEIICAFSIKKFKDIIMLDFIYTHFDIDMEDHIYL